MGALESTCSLSRYPPSPHRRASRPFLRVSNCIFKALFLKGLLGWGSPHHELEEEPGVLQDQLTHCTAAHHPLQSQLLVQQLQARPGSLRATSHPTHTPLRKASLGGCSRKPCWGSEQQAMQDGMRADPVPAGLWMWGGALDPLLMGQWGRHQVSHPTVPSTFCTVCLG